jgi:hypothetical protein
MAKSATAKSTEDVNEDTLWGVDGERGIARFLGLPASRVYYLASRGMIPTRKIGFKTIVASKSELRAHLRARADGCDHA